MTTTPNMSLVLPTPGGDIGTWDDIENAAFTLIDSHDHTAGRGVRIPVSGLNVNADISLAGLYSLTNLKSLDFTAITALSSGAHRIFFSSADNELYVRSNSGVNIKITSGAGLNLSAIGGIVGDYASVGAEVAYDDANDRYTFKQQTGGGGVKQWATRAGGHVDIFEQLATASGTTISNRVRLSSPAALASSYVVTFPAAVPASIAFVQASSAGVLTFATRLVAPSDVGHGNMELLLMASQGVNLSGSIAVGGTNVDSTAAGEIWLVWIPLKTGDRIRSIKIWYQRGGGTLTFDLMEFDGATHALTSKATTSIASGTSETSITLASIDYTLTTNHAYCLQFTSGSATDHLNSIQVTYDRP